MATIATIVPYKFLPPANGGHLGILIVEKLLAEKNEVHTFSTTDNVPQQDLPFVTHFIIPDKKSRYIPYSGYKHILEQVKEHKPDYIFCHHHYLFFTAKKIARKLGVPLYIRSHNIESTRFRDLGKKWWPLMFIFEKWAYRHSDKVFFVTSEDREWAIRNYKIKQAQSAVLPFASDFDSIPSCGITKEEVARQHHLSVDVPWFFFMGQLDYKPNREAVSDIIDHVLPLLRTKLPDGFHILIFGKGLAEDIQEQIKKTAQNNDIMYMGFVPSLAAFLKHCCVMLNPVRSGGGIKTKAIESLAWNKTVVSTDTGAIGIERSVCGKKLLISTSGNWEEFVNNAINATVANDNIPQEFFDFYYFGNIAERIQEHFVKKVK